MFDPKPHLIQLPRRVKDPQTGQWTTRLEDYLEVKWRLVWFRERCPHGVITTEEICVDLDHGYARFRCVVADGEGGQATGYGTETAVGFADYVERAETRALGRALAALGIGTQFVGQDLTEGEHVVDAPVAPLSPASRMIPTYGGIDANGASAGEQLPGKSTPENQDLTAERLTPDQARELKKVAQTAFGYAEGERRLRHDLGFEVDERLTLRHLAAHVTTERYQTLMERYTAVLKQAVDADVP
jgi:hypothetical protein